MKALKFLASLLVGSFLGTGLFFAPEAGAILKGSSVFVGGSVPTATTFPDGTKLIPSIGWTSDADGSGTGQYRRAANVWTTAINGVDSHEISSTGVRTNSGMAWGWSSSATTVNSNDTTLLRASANSIQFGGAATAAGAATARTEANVAIASIANAVATDVLTITIPNAAHSASLLVRLTCSLGAGGAIGANEATATNSYVISLTRTAGVNATAAISSAFGGAATAVAGAATVTATAAMSSVVGAVGATNTFTVQATVSRSGGSSTNHTCLVYAQLMNANATGITFA